MILRCNRKSRKENRKNSRIFFERYLENCYVDIIYCSAALVLPKDAAARLALSFCTFIGRFLPRLGPRQFAALFLRGRR